MTTMKAAQIQRFSDDVSSFTFAEVPLEAPRPGFVVVKVRAAASNPVDWKVMAGLVKDAWSCPLPLVPGYDFSGTVSGVGAGVTEFSVGDDVFGVNWGTNDHGAGTDDEPIGGAFAEYISLPAGKIAHKPAAISHPQAAAIALVGTTASQGLELIKSGPGKRVVILGGSTAVGMVAVQLAKLQGATVFTTCSPRTRPFVEELGADRTIDYTVGPWFEDSELVSAKVDAVFDTVGQDGTFAGARSVLKEDGSFLSIASFEAGVDPGGHSPLAYAARYCLVNDAGTLTKLGTLLEDGALRLPIEDEFPFTHEGITALLQKQKDGKSTGKNVLIVS